MNGAFHGTYRIRRIDYGMHRCDGTDIFEYSEHGRELLFFLDHEASQLVEQGAASYRARLPREFADDAVPKGVLQWRIEAARNMARFFRTDPFWADERINLDELDTFDGHHPRATFR